MQVFHERRGHRSDSKREALMLQLRASARRAGVEAMVLADHRGRVIARSDRDTVAEELASFSPFLAKPKTWFGKIQFEGRSRSVAVSPSSWERTPPIFARLGQSDERSRAFFSKPPLASGES